MAIEFLASSNESVYGGIAPASGGLPFRVTIPFKMGSNPSDNQYIFYMGDKDSTSDWFSIDVDSSGAVRAWARGFSPSPQATSTNSIDTSGVNVVTAIVDDLGAGTLRVRIKLNGGSVASDSRSPSSSTHANWDRVSFGRLEDSSPSNAADCQIEQPFMALDNDDFADHDTVWNSGTPLDPSTLTLGEDHRWPFDAESGNVGATDTEIDDAVGALDLDAINGSPTYVANFLTAAGGGVTGSASLTLPALTLSATAEVAVEGSADLALPALALTAAAEVGVEAEADLTLPALQLSAAGSVQVSAAATLTLPALQVSAAGVVDVEGQADLTLPALELAAAAAARITATADLTLPALTLAATIGELIPAVTRTALCLVSADQTAACVVSGEQTAECLVSADQTVELRT